MKIYIIIMVLFSIGYAAVWFSAKPELRRHFGPGFYCSYALIVLAATFAPNALSYGLCCTILIAVTVRSRMDAVCRMVMMVILTPSSLTSLNLGSMFLWQSSTIDFVVIGGALGLLRMGRRDPRPLAGFTGEDALVLTLFLVFWLGPSRFPSLTIVARSCVTTALQVGLPYFVLRRSIRSSSDVKTVAACVAAAGLISALFAVYESRTGWEPFLLLTSRFKGDFQYGLALATRGGALRPTAATGNALVLAVLLAFGFIAAACSGGFLRSRKIFAGWLVILTLGLVASQSRGNLACLALAGVLLLALTGRRLLAALMAMGAAFGYEMLLVLAGWSPRIAAFLNVGSGAGKYHGHYDYRGFLLERGLQEAAKHPWLGAGADSVMLNLSDLVQGQGIIDLVNTYLWIYLIAGLIGLAGVVGFASLVMIRLTAARTRDNAERHSARTFTLVSLIVILIELSFVSFVFCIPFLVVAILACSRAIRLERGRPAAVMQSGEAVESGPPGPSLRPKPAPAMA